MKPFALKANLWAGAAILAGSAAVLAAGFGFMQTWFYSFAWWSTILILDSVNFRLQGSSPLSRSVKDFFLLAFVSVPVWLVFELYNLALNNWNYHHLPPERGIRWLGYFIAFATVVPALKELGELWTHILRKSSLSLVRFPASAAAQNIFIITGIFCLTLPAFIPKAAFPLIWLGFIFFLDPLNHRYGRDSLLRELSQNQWNRFIGWALAGMTAGLLWEGYNFWSGSHWEYTVPFFNFGKIFQMPVLGYFGFAPFAIEIFAFLVLYRHIRERLQNRPWAYAVIAILLLLFDAWVFSLIDAFTWAV
jgi:hypothetical protein